MACQLRQEYRPDRRDFTCRWQLHRPFAVKQKSLLGVFAFGLCSLQTTALVQSSRSRFLASCGAEPCLGLGSLHNNDGLGEGPALLTPLVKLKCPAFPNPPGSPGPHLQVFFASVAASSSRSYCLDPGPLCLLPESAVVLPSPCSAVCAQALAFEFCVWGDMEAALDEARCRAVALVLYSSSGMPAICGFRIFDDRGRRGCWRQMMRLCSESRAAKLSLNLVGDFLGTGPLAFCRSQ